MEYVSGDPILIKNIVTQLKSQGIFDQIRKECIADVDTKPAYQNLCHRADTQVSKFLNKVKWAPDLHKNQTRENIRRQVNECNFVEPGIAIIVDQLVNPRINTVLVPKVEDMLYKYLGIPREVDTTAGKKETKSFNDGSSFRDIPDRGVPGIPGVEINDRKKDFEKQSVENHFRMENQRNDAFNSIKNDSSTNKIQSFGDKSNRDRSSSITTEPYDNFKDSNKSIKTEPEKYYSRMDMKEPPIQDFDSESSDDEMSPPFEPNVKSDDDMSLGSGDSDFSEIIDMKVSNEPDIPGVEPDIPGVEPEIPGVEPDIPGVDPEIDTICKADDSKIITEHEDSMDSVRSTYSNPPEPEKVQISPLEIPKTPTINYETSDDSDDYVKNKQLLDTVAVDAAEPLEVPEVNFDKIVEKVIEDNSEPKALEIPEMNPPKEEDKYKDKNRSDDAKKKDKSKYKDEKPVKPAESKEKHPEKKSEHRSDKDRKYDKHRSSEHKSKDREKDKPKHDSSKSHSRKDDKSHHSRDHSKSDHDRKSKSEHRKDDKTDVKKDPGKSEHKKDDRSDHKKDDKTEHRKDPRTDRKKEDEKKHSLKDDKDRKKDPRKTSSSDDKKSSKPAKTDDSKHKYDKPRDDKKSSKNGDHNKSKKKDEDAKKSRSHCNIDDKKKTDRRSSDRDSSGPSTSNSSVFHASSQHSSKSDKDKGSTKHRHSSSSSSSHKTKRNDSEHEKNRSEKPPNDQEKNAAAAEDDLEMILESSPDKSFQCSIKSESNFSVSKILPDKVADQSNDHIENMMNEMFQPTKPVLKKPKIAKNFADIRRIMKLRKLYEEDFKLKGNEPNANESTSNVDKSTLYKVKLRRTVDFFVMRRFGKNGNNLEKCKELTNAIIETLTDVKLNITRVDRRYSLIDGSCMLSDDENSPIYNNAEDVKTNGTKNYDELDNMKIIEDERANLILEDLANSYTDPNFKLGNVPEDFKSDQPIVKVPLLEDDTIRIVQSEIKANGAKTRLPKQLTPTEEDDSKSKLINESTSQSIAEEDDASLNLKLKIKSISDGKSKSWQACDNSEQIEEPLRYFPLPNYNSNFIQFANKMLNDAYDFEVENLAVEMDYPECYDFMFVQFLGAKVNRRKSDDPKTSPIKYNSEIINKKLGDKSIMLRIKKTPESEESAAGKILNKKRKLADDSGVELDNPDSCKDEEPVKKKKKTKTLGIKRTFVNPLKMKLTSGQFNDTIGNDLTETTLAAKAKITPVPKKVAKVIKSKEMAVANANHKKSESESSDGRRSSISSTGASTYSKGIDESIASVVAAAAAEADAEAAAAETTTATTITLASTKSKTKNITLNDSKLDTIETNASESAATTKTPDPPAKKPNDTKNAEEKRKQSIMNCYYDESDLYKPRPSLRLTSRRYRCGNTEDT